MPRKDPKNEALDIAKAAYWRVARPDLPINHLAAMLGVARTTLEKRIEAAREREWIRDDWIFTNLPGELWEVLSKTIDTNLQERIIRLYGKRNLPELTVVPAWPPKMAGAPDTEVDADQVNMGMVAHAAAWVFLNRLRQMRFIGLSYGRTLRKMIDVLEHFGPAVRGELTKKSEDGKLEIITVFGSLSFRFSDKRHGEWLEHSASHLTNRLARILGTDMCHRRFLETPVYVPPAFLDLFTGKETGKGRPGGVSKGLSEEKALQIAKAFIEALPTYQDTFVGSESAIERLDTVITSVGDLETGCVSPAGGLEIPFLRKEEGEAFRKEAVGDITGCYVTRDGHTGEPGTTIAKVNGRIFGPTIEDLERIAARAASNETPGVIVAASGRKKARVISALLSRQKKVISELVISGDLAEELVGAHGNMG